jgi:hypothetical protein
MQKAAVSAILRPMQLGQKPRRLQEKDTTRLSPQSLQRMRTLSASPAIPPLDRSKLTSLVWRLRDDMSGACTADFLIDNLSFY